MVDQVKLDRILGASDHVASFLATQQIDFYWCNHPYLIWLPLLIEDGGIVANPVLLPDDVSDDAERIASEIRPWRDEGERAVQWCMENHQDAIKVELSVPPYGVPDIALMDSKILVECGDTRFDKPITGLALGYQILVVPYEEGLPHAKAIADKECDAILFSVDRSNESWTWFVDHHDEIIGDYDAPAFRSRTNKSTR